MWIYEKKLQFPVKIKNPNPKLAQIIISQLGGPDGELAASMRYLHQRYSMPYKEVVGILTDVGSEASKTFRAAPYSHQNEKGAALRLPFAIGAGKRT
jgi:spore coat protein JC